MFVCKDSVLDMYGGRVTGSLFFSYKISILMVNRMLRHLLLFHLRNMVIVLKFGLK